MWAYLAFRAPRPVFLGDIRNFLRRQPYEGPLIRAPPVGLRASPQVKIAFLLIDPQRDT